MPYSSRKRPRDGVHKVVSGDSIDSISASYGIAEWEEKVWNASENAKLKEQRVNPNTLAPKDQVFIPMLEEKQENRPVDNWHEFHVVRNRRFIRLKLADEKGAPYANKQYKIEAEESFKGEFVQKGTTTDENGMIEEEVPFDLLVANVLLPEESLHVRIRIAFLLPLPMTDPVQVDPAAIAASLQAAAGGLLDAAKGGASGLLDAAGSAAAGAAGSLTGSLGGGLSASASGGASTSGGAAGGGGAGGGLGGLGAAASGAAGGLAGAASGAMGALGAAAAAAGPLVNAVAKLMGKDAIFSEEDKNVPPAAQRLISMGFDCGPQSNKPNAAFTAALLEFQTWCKEKGMISQGAGGLAGGLPGSISEGIGGGFGSTLGSLANTALSKVGLTGRLDQESIDALKKVHGC